MITISLLAVFLFNQLATVYFEDKNNGFWVASKSAHGTSPVPAHMLPTMDDKIRAQALIQCHAGGTANIVYFSGCYICVTPTISGSIQKTTYPSRVRVNHPFLQIKISSRGI